MPSTSTRSQLFIVIGVFLCMLVVTIHPIAAGPPEYAVLIVLDGFRSDYLERFDAPTLRMLAEEGVRYEGAVGVFPSNSTVNQTSLVTGAYPKTTGIPNNSRYDRAAGQIIAPLRDNRAITIAQAFREAGLRTASVSHYMLEGHVDAYTRNLGEGLMWLRGTNPPNLLVYLNLEIDAAGHSSGPFSSRTAQEVARADAEVQLIIDLLKERGIYDRTVIVVVSDHGMSPAGGKLIYPNLEYQLWAHGFTVAKENREIIERTDIVHVQHGSAFLYLREGHFDTEREEELIHLLRQIEGVEVLGREDLHALHTDPHLVGDIVVVPKDGYTLYPGSASSGIHGRPQERHITLILSGAGVRKGVVLQEAVIVDVVPTLLTLFDLPVPATVDGRILTEALESYSEHVAN